MMKKLYTVVFLLFGFTLMVFAQERMLKPLGTVYVSKDNRVPEVIVVQPDKGNVESKISHNGITINMDNVLGTIDTLSYRKSLGGNWNTNFGLFSDDYMVSFYEAPADLVIKQIGFTCSDNVSVTTEMAIKLYKVGNGVTLDELLNTGAAGVKQGRFVSADPNYSLGFVGFEDESDGSGYENVGNVSAFPYAEDIWSDAGFGLPIVPVVSPNTAPVYQYVSMTDLGFEPTVGIGDIIAIVVKNNGVGFNANRIGLWSLGVSSTPAPSSWKFYVHGRTDGDPTTAYWYSREFVWDLVAVVDLVGDRPPVISEVTALSTTLSTQPREVTCRISDDNPSGGPAGVASALLQYALNGDTIWTDVTMTRVSGTDIDGNYSASLPGQSEGTKVSYRIKAADVNANESNSLPINYSIFQKQNDVLFIYNSGNFTGTTPQRLYIGYSVNPYIIDPVDNDIWLASYGTDEASQVMSLYKWVIQVDGSFPVADFSDAAKEYLDGATSTDPRNYLLSSQDYGCFLNGTCADIDFVAGDFQYDYLGVDLLGPQDLTAAAGVKVEITPVAGDPVSGWVEANNTANGVTYWFDPTFELAFTGYIDAMTPTSTATSIFTTGGQTVGVKNEGANWKTAFLAFDYAGSNFRSDTSLTPANDPKYAWGVEVGNQAREFLEWAGYVSDVHEIGNGVPKEFNLSQNYPNPFNPSTVINFDIQKSSQVELKVFDILGREVQTLVNNQMAPGSYKVDFNASKLSSGVYFYTIKAGDFVSSKKMILVK